MIEEVRKLPNALLAVGASLVALFVLVVIATVVAVASGDGSEPPTPEDLPLAVGTEALDSIVTCTEEACDGVGVLVAGGDGHTPIEGLAEHWRLRGWDEVPCMENGLVCFAEGDLRISLSAWDEADHLKAPTLVELVADRGLDSSTLAFVHLYRCGTIVPCGPPAR